MTDLSRAREALAEIARIHEQAKTMVAELESAPVDWAPKMGERYWTCSNNGPFDCQWDGNGQFDKRALASGNVFPTAAAAKRADERRILEVALRRAARKAGKVARNGTWYELAMRDSAWAAVFSAAHRGLPRFPTHESAEAAIAEFGDRLNLLLDDA